MGGGSCATEREVGIVFYGTGGVSLVFIEGHAQSGLYIRMRTIAKGHKG